MFVVKLSQGCQDHQTYATDAIEIIFNWVNIFLYYRNIWRCAKDIFNSRRYFLRTYTWIVLIQVLFYVLSKRRTNYSRFYKSRTYTLKLANKSPINIRIFINKKRLTINWIEQELIFCNCRLNSNEKLLFKKKVSDTVNDLYLITKFVEWLTKNVLDDKSQLNTPQFRKGEDLPP